MGRIVFRELHGLVLLDKPLGLSSNQALQEVRRLFRAAKGGHTGALDPLASGLLPLCFGEGTKLATHLLGARKAYHATCRLGTTTTTGDLEGEVVSERPVPVLDEATIEAALAPLRGRIRQVPPVYSAIKQGGEPLYIKARRGEAVDIPAREVEVHRLVLAGREGDLLHLEVECGTGTYIRSLATDLGESLGCGAHLTALRRTWVEPFMSPRMYTLDELRERAARGDEALQEAMLPVAVAVAHLPAIRLDAAQSQAVAQGRRIAPEDGAVAEGLCAAFADDGTLLALVETGPDGLLRIQRGFNLPPGG